MSIWLRAIYAIWIVWGAAWALAWLWANRTTGAATTRVQAPYRAINLIGWVALFGDGALRYGPDGLHRATWAPPIWHVPDALGWALALIALAAMLFAFWARATLGRLWSAAVTRKEGHRVVAEGPYAIVRHPIYTAILGAALALAVAQGTPIALGGAALMIVGYVMKARVEECFLAVALGVDDYAEYRRRVPMLVPFASASG